MVPELRPGNGFWRSSTSIALAAVALTVSSGIIQGRLVQRWGGDLPQAVQRIDGFPEAIGPWKLRSSAPLSETAVRMLRCQGHFDRTYIHERTGEIVSVALMVGPASPLATHRPEVCYQSSNYTVCRPRRAVKLIDEAGSPHFFSLVDFQLNDASGRRLLVYYAWSIEETWISPANPRFALAAEPMLYKVQVAGFAGISHDGGTDSAKRFLEYALAYLVKVCRSLNS